MKKFICSLLLAMSISPAHSSVIINNTRVIYPSDSTSVSVQLVNNAASGHLIQTWVDDGNANARPEDLKVPFLVSPAVVKISGNSGQILRIRVINPNNQLPKDREAVYWLNVLDIPPVPDNSVENYLQFAIRSRIKLFWRPVGLKIQQTDIPRMVHLNSNGSSTCLNNQTPYYLTIIQMTKGGGQSTAKQNLLNQAIMAAPFSCEQLKGVKGKITAGQYQLVRLDDYGARISFVVTAN